ncbi:MAG TPA: hypothetical protein VJL80_09900 [Aeromicrobium sp.]|nr:hypothetical protein [Aeromicrobium sp.]HKY58339.1 hypothetical protein [Aeromicrobium sp.]
MSRLMSVAFTEQAVVERRKTVTRRKGWWEDKNGRRILKPGDRLTLCRKVMGRKKGEPLVRLAEVEVVSVRREPLRDVVDAGELTKEGFPEWDDPTDSWGAFEFIERYFTPQGIDPLDDVTRIEWRYLDGEAAS